ncbi:phosphatidylserine decarboxylase [Chiua virens]|nr:phosphatidylserine decarboxylase [Chiua virens]
MPSQEFGNLTKRSTYYAWVPQTNLTHDDWVKKLIDSALQRERERLPHKLAVQAFAEKITPEQIALFEQALEQVGQYYKKWADDSAVINTFNEFLYLLDGIIESPPDFYKAQIGGQTIGEPIGVPLYLILDLLSNTSAAYSLFTQPSFNQALKGFLDSWGAYLKTEPSNTSLPRWFSPEGLAVLESGLGKLSFFDTYATDYTDSPYYKSWDAFFTRELKQGVRPVQTDPTTPSRNNTFLYNACECTVLRTVSDVQTHDTFWLKSQKYSLWDALGGKLEGSLAQYAQKLQGGEVYQAFLSPQDYHRWHSPINGKVLATKVFPGTYYAVLPDDGAPEYDPDLEPGDPHGALIRSQPWLSVSAARAVFIMEAERTSPIDLIAFIAIGMAEVSTCEVTVKTDDFVKVGGQLGTFHFGGSSHALIVKPKNGYKIFWQDYYNTPIRPGQHRWVNSVIAQLRKVDQS